MGERVERRLQNFVIRAILVVLFLSLSTDCIPRLLVTEKKKVSYFFQFFPVFLVCTHMHTPTHTQMTGDVK